MQLLTIFASDFKVILTVKYRSTHSIQAPFHHRRLCDAVSSLFCSNKRQKPVSNTSPSVLISASDDPGIPTLSLNTHATCVQLFELVHFIVTSCNKDKPSTVSCSALEYCLNTENLNLSAIRTIRVLRPLRAINRIPSKYSATAAVTSPDVTAARIKPMLTTLKSEDNAEDDDGDATEAGDAPAEEEAASAKGESDDSGDVSLTTH